MTDGDAATPGAGDGSGEVDDVVASVAGARTSQVVHVADVDEVARTLADRIDGELVEGHDGFVDGLDARVEQLVARTSARAALDRHAELEASADDVHRVTDVASLRTLVRRVHQSAALVEASREQVVDRASSASDLSVHPDSIRAAAADLVAARSQLAEVLADLEAEAAELEATRAAGRPDGTGTDGDDETGRDDRSLVDRVRTPLGRSVTVLLLALALAVLVLVTTGVVLALVLPACAAVWVTVVLVRRRDSAMDEEMASRNLARVAAFTDEAYGGGVVAEPDVLDREGRRRAAEDRLRYTEQRWVDLVGPDADVDDLDRVLQVHDPRFGLDDLIVEGAPTVRAAEAHRRRLSAQWKLAWWALDREVPPIAAADDALDGLVADGIEVVSVPTHAGRLAPDRSGYDDLAAGRSLDELRADAASEWPVLVVADPDGAVDETEFRAGTTRLSEDVLVVLVAPVPDQAGER